MAEYQLEKGIHPNNTIRYLLQENPREIIVHAPSGDLVFRKFSSEGWYCSSHLFITGFTVKHDSEIEFFSGCIIGGSTIETDKE